MPASAGIVSVLISAPKRGLPASMRRISAAAGVDLDGAGGEQRVAQAAGLGGGRDQVDPVLGADRRGTRRRQTVAASLPCRGGEGVPATATAARADQREDRPLLADVLDLDLAADLVGLEMAAGDLERLAARCRARAPGRGRGAAPACRPACGPCGRAAPRSSPRRAPAPRRRWSAGPAGTRPRRRP